MSVKSTPISEVISELGLPSDTQFMGYVIHLPDSDEFLSISFDDEYVEGRAWAKTPVLARTYMDYYEALSEAKKCKNGAVVCLLFDTEDQLYVQPIAP